MSVEVGGEYPEVHRESIVRARKEHRCAACHETIRAGDRYAYQYLILEGTGYTTKRCLRCQAIHEHLREKCRAFNREARLDGLDEDEERYPDDALNCGRTYKSEWGAEPPAEIAALAFALPDEMQGKAGQ